MQGTPWSSRPLSKRRSAHAVLASILCAAWACSPKPPVASRAATDRRGSTLERTQASRLATAPAAPAQRWAIAKLSEESNVYQIELDGDYVYWAECEHLRRAKRTSPVAELLYTAADTCLSAFALHDGFVYFAERIDAAQAGRATQGSRLLRQSTRGGPVESVLVSPVAIQGLATYGKGLLMLQPTGLSLLIAVDKPPKQLLLLSNIELAQGLQVHGDTAYFIDETPVGAGNRQRLIEVSLDQGTATTLSESCHRAAIGERAIYCADHQLERTTALSASDISTPPELIVNHRLDKNPALRGTPYQIAIRDNSLFLLLIAAGTGVSHVIRTDLGSKETRELASRLRGAFALAVDERSVCWGDQREIECRETPGPDAR